MATPKRAQKSEQPAAAVEKRRYINGWHDPAMLLLAAIVGFTVSRMESCGIRGDVHANRADINAQHLQQIANITRLDDQSAAIEAYRTRLFDAESQGDNTETRVDALWVKLKMGTQDAARK